MLNNTRVPLSIVAAAGRSFDLYQIHFRGRVFSRCVCSVRVVLFLVCITLVADESQHRERHRSRVVEVKKKHGDDITQPIGTDWF